MVRTAPQCECTWYHVTFDTHTHTHTHRQTHTHTYTYNIKNLPPDNNLFLINIDNKWWNQNVYWCQNLHYQMWFLLSNLLVGTTYWWEQLNESQITTFSRWWSLLDRFKLQWGKQKDCRLRLRMAGYKRLFSRVIIELNFVIYNRDHLTLFLLSR